MRILDEFHFERAPRLDSPIEVGTTFSGDPTFRAFIVRDDEKCQATCCCCHEAANSDQERFADIIKTLADERGVLVGSPGKKGFGSSAPQVDGKTSP